MVAPSALLLYNPTLHRGYLELYHRHGGHSVTLYIIGNSLLAEIPRAERDVSRIDPVVMKNLVESLGFFGKVVVLEKERVTIPEKRIVANDHMVVKTVIEKYLKGREITYDTTFLRWDMPRALSAHAPDATAKVTRDALDKALMEKAQETAKRSPDWWRQVGALVARKGKLLLPPVYNQHVPREDVFDDEGDPRSWIDVGEHLDVATGVHCEVRLIAEAARQGISLTGSDLYVTTFPCPNCANLVAISGIKRLFYAGGYSQLNGQRVLEDAEVELIKVEG